MIDVLEGPPDIITIIEAPERQKVTEYIMDILDSVDSICENLRVLPVRESVEKKPGRNWQLIKREDKNLERR
jgi:hypothetical protein